MTSMVVGDYVVGVTVMGSCCVGVTMSDDCWPGVVGLCDKPNALLPGVGSFIFFGLAAFGLCPSRGNFDGSISRICWTPVAASEISNTPSLVKMWPIIVLPRT